jgi:CRISPR system Cascade subunit CasC
MLIEFHILKSYPPTNLNRDETGSPKSCFFGGSQRGRISSQCLKHSWRRHDAFSNLNIGIRTRYLPELIAEELFRRGMKQEYLEIVKKKISGLGNKEAKESEDGSGTAQIMFFSKEDINAVADIVETTVNSCKSIKEIKDIKVKIWQDALKGNAKVRPVTLDIALFGRMITDDSFADVEASIQVAHAISTNRVNMESDFFTAVDDLKKMYSDDVGSAMMGDTDFNSCCYYMYSSLDTDQLFENLKSSPDVAEISKVLIPILIETMAFSNPSGKQNSFAGNVYPSLICVEVKDKKVPINYVNAFEIPVSNTSTKGLVKESVDKLAREIDNFDSVYGLDIVNRYWFSAIDSECPQKAQKINTMQELLKSCSRLID